MKRVGPSQRRLGAARRLPAVAIALLVLGQGGTRTLDAAGTDETGAPIVVELFTSQGCSSCPPADRFLTELASRDDLGIVALSFHVDYWNYIGWTDPFSSVAWSDRQREYARIFGGNRYTPQMVVNGRWEAVGSNRREVTRLLARATVKPRRTEVDLSVQRVSEDRIRVTVGVRGLDALGRHQLLGAWVAIVESNLVTSVGRGENASKTLRNDRVVRHLEQVLDFDPTTRSSGAALEISLGEAWLRDRLSVVAFLQDAASLEIQGAVELALER